MYYKKDKRYVKRNLKQGNLDDLVISNPNLTDSIILTMFKKDYLSGLEDSFLDGRRNNSSIPLETFLILGVAGKLNLQNALSDIPYAIRDIDLLNKLGWNKLIKEDFLDKGIMSEGSIRSFIEKQDAEYFSKGYNNYVKNHVLPKLSERPVNHLLDCTIIEGHGEYNKYDQIGTTIRNGKTIHGFKLCSLKGLLPLGGGITEAISIGLVNEHDFNLSDCIIKSGIFKEGDNLIQDSGFIDRNTINNLKKNGINTYVRVKRNMEIYKEAVALACKTPISKWKKHPTKKKQKIITVEELGNMWVYDKKDDVELTAAVVYDEKKDKYYVFVTSDTTKKARSIINTYQLRPEIEEDYRQKKVYWNLEKFTSKKYNTIAFHIFLTALGFLFYQLFTQTKTGEKYLGKSIQTAFIIFDRDKLREIKGKDARFVIYYNGYFGIFKVIELMDIYADVPKKIRAKIKKVMR